MDLEKNFFIFCGSDVEPVSKCPPLTMGGENELKIVTAKNHKTLVPTR